MGFNKAVISFVCLLCWFINLSGFALQSRPAALIKGNPDTIPADFFNKRYLHYNPEQFLEHHYDFALYQIETVGDFSLPDPYVFTFNGYSNLWNSYYYEGHCMDDLFFPGNPLHKVQMFNHGLIINPAEATLEFITTGSQQNRAGVQFNHGGLGGKAPFVDDMVRLFHSTAEERMLVPITYRRKIKNAVSAYANYPITGKSGTYNQQFHFTGGRRMLTGFGYYGLSAYYPEDYLFFHHSGELPVLTKKLFDRNGYLFSFMNRDHLFAELYYGRNETVKLNATAVSFFGQKTAGAFRYNAGINFSHKNLALLEPGYERNLLDYDGEGLEPWIPGQNFYECSVHFKYSRALSKNFDLQVEMFEGLGIFRPVETTFVNYLYHQSSPSDRTNLYIIEWESNAFQAGILRNNALLRYHFVSTNKKLLVDARVGLTLHGMVLAGSSLVKPNLESHLNLSYQFARVFSASLSAGRKPVPFNFDQIRFLSNDYQSGDIFFWNDNRDFYTTTGGSNHTLTESIQQPSIIYLDIPFVFNTGARSRIQLTGQYRLFNNLWTVNFDKDPTLYGQFDDVEGEQIYFQNPGEVQYIVDNTDKKWMQAATGTTGYFFSQPFYAGSTLNYSKEGQKLYFSASVTAYMVVGSGEMGNGVLHNNIGTLSESMANPNSRLNNMGRLDTDRSYLGKLFVSWELHPAFTLAFQFSYRDGQPISNFGLELKETDEGYLSAIWRKKLPGDNPFTGDMGAREDGFFNSVLRCRYIAKITGKHRIAFNLSVYNIYDFGTALSEFVFPPVRDNGRYVLDICIPRGLTFSCELMF